MLAAAERVYRPVKADVGRVVAREDRAWMLDGDGGSAGGYAVQRFDGVEPVALNVPGLQAEARGSGIAGCPAPAVGLDRHVANLACHQEHNKNDRGSVGET